MLPTKNPIVKTDTELRRSINRLENYRDNNPHDEQVKDGTVDQLIEDLKEVRRHIPANMRDQDIVT